MTSNFFIPPFTPFRQYDKRNFTKGEMNGQRSPEILQGKGSG